MRRSAATAFAMVGCVLEFLITLAAGKRDAASRARVLQKWSARLLRWFNVALTVEGTPPSAGLIVSNHVSYLDILAFSAAAPCAFVSKKEIRSWPGVGWAASMAGCVFIDRERRSATRAIQPQMHAALSGGSRLVLFPEGTSSDGTRLLPFRSSLLQPAVADGAPITAAYVHYAIDDGNPALMVSYWGDMTLLGHALKMFAKNGVRATLRFGSAPRVFASRKEAAEKLWQEVYELGQLIQFELT
ncbi:MAG TPA: lysophospholipid acyltransferase family protein [Terriglobales bacterium]|nr:lysophospholipid acyltransferase family protein [Terriglobales bacterium]